MRRTFLLSIAAWLLTAVLLSGLWVPAAASSDPVEAFSREYLQAVRDGKTEAEITIRDTGDFEALMFEAFSRYPVLSYYYAGAQWQTFSTKTVATCKLEHVEEAPEDIPVIDSEEELMAVLGLGLARADQGVSFVCRAGFFPDSDMISAQFDRLKHDHYLCYMGYHGFSYTYTTHDNGVTTYDLTYTYFYDLSPETVRQWRAETEAVAVSLAGSLFASDMPDYERVLRIHDWIINNTRYNTRDLEEAGNHLAYGALVKGSCVCQGYAEAFLLLANAAGLEVAYVSGDATNSTGATESHAWNAVKVQGDWYMIDPTWDDPTSSDGSDVLRYDYFLVSGQQLARDHTWDQASAPACTAESMDAQWVLDQSAQNQTAYQLYDSGAIKTMAQSTAELSRIIPAAPDLPGTAPAPATAPTAAPTVALPEETDPPVQTQPTAPPDTPSGEDQEKGSFLWILVILAVLLGGGGGAVWYIRSRTPSRRYGSPFGSTPSRRGGSRRPSRNEHRKVQW